MARQWLFFPVHTDHLGTGYGPGKASVNIDGPEGQARLQALIGKGATILSGPDADTAHLGKPYGTEPKQDSSTFQRDVEQATKGNQAEPPNAIERAAAVHELDAATTTAPVPSAEPTIHTGVMAEIMKLSEPEIIHQLGTRGVSIEGVAGKEAFARLLATSAGYKVPGPPDQAPTASTPPTTPPPAPAGTTRLAGIAEDQQPAPVATDGQSQEGAAGGSDTETQTALPEDFPGLAALDAAGIKTVEAVRAHPDLQKIHGIGAATADQIKSALDDLEDE